VRSSAAAALALIAALGAGGCGEGKSQSDPDAARAAVSGFSSAFGSGDGSKACDLLTPAAQAAIVKRVKVLTAANDCPTAIKRLHDAAGSQVTSAFATARVSDVQVKGAGATARLTAAGHSAPVALTKQDGDWKLTGVPGL
jgi:hypothetical protein